MALSSEEAFLAVLWRALRDAGLEAILVGSGAAAVQGAPVTTQDYDLLMRDTELNRIKLAAVAKRIGAARPRKISALTSTLTLAGGDIPVDVLLDQMAGDLTFQAVRSRAVRARLDDVEVVMACLPDIIASKRAAGRPKDKAQLPILEATWRVLEELQKAKP
jgi:CheY-like chemotaxis protein